MKGKSSRNDANAVDIWHATSVATIDSIVERVKTQTNNRWACCSLAWSSSVSFGLKGFSKNSQICVWNGTRTLLSTRCEKAQLRPVLSRDKTAHKTVLIKLDFVCSRPFMRQKHPSLTERGWNSPHISFRRSRISGRVGRPPAGSSNSSNESDSDW